MFYPGFLKYRIVRTTSLAFTPDGRPAIAYYNQSKQELKYAVRAPVASP